MKHTTIDPVGAEVTGFDARAADHHTAARLRALLAERGVVVLRDQQLDDDAFVAFLRSFGELYFTKGETPAPGHADLNVVSNIGRDTPPKSNFHVDTSYVREPPAYTSLRAVQIPASGGETIFSNQYRAYDTLPEELRAELDGRTITHVVTGVELEPGDEASAEHPVFRPHPVTGRIALYLTSPKRCAAISGMDAERTEATVARLLDHSTREDNVYRHAWRPGDLVVWDNACVLHRADHSKVEGDRVMHRGMVAAYAEGSPSCLPVPSRLRG